MSALGYRSKYRVRPKITKYLFAAKDSDTDGRKIENPNQKFQLNKFFEFRNNATTIVDTAST